MVQPRYSSLTPDQLRVDLPLRARSDNFAAILRCDFRATFCCVQFITNQLKSRYSSKQKVDFRHTYWLVQTGNSSSTAVCENCTYIRLELKFGCSTCHSEYNLLKKRVK